MSKTTEELLRLSGYYPFKDPKCNTTLAIAALAVVAELEQAEARARSTTDAERAEQARLIWERDQARKELERAIKERDEARALVSLGKTLLDEQRKELEQAEARARSTTDAERAEQARLIEERDEARKELEQAQATCAKKDAALVNVWDWLCLPSTNEIDPDLVREAMATDCGAAILERLKNAEAERDRYRKLCQMVLDWATAAGDYSRNSDGTQRDTFDVFAEDIVPQIDEALRPKP